MPTGRMNDVTKALGQIDVKTHPLFSRLFHQEGFSWIDEDEVEAFLHTPGFKMVIFAEDPNAKRVTVDIAVIAPELKKAFAGILVKTVFARFDKARAIASRWGITGLPAVALFRDDVYLGATQGLKDWNTYCRELSEIVVREKAPARRVSLVAATQQEQCSD